MLSAVSVAKCLSHVEVVRSSTVSAFLGVNNPWYIVSCIPLQVEHLYHAIRPAFILCRWAFCSALKVPDLTLEGGNNVKATLFVFVLF